VFGLLSAVAGELWILETSFGEDGESAKGGHVFGVESDGHFEGFGGFEWASKSEQGNCEQVVCVWSIVLDFDGIESVVQSLSGILADEHAACEAEECVDIFGVCDECLSKGVGGSGEIAKEQLSGAESEQQVRISG
jgi:hypothetical protein